MTLCSEYVLQTTLLKKFAQGIKGARSEQPLGGLHRADATQKREGRVLSLLYGSPAAHEARAMLTRVQDEGFHGPMSGIHGERMSKKLIH